MSDYIKRSTAIEIAQSNLNPLSIIKMIENLPSADVAPVGYEEDGTLWVTVKDCEKVCRVIVRNEQVHFCRVFYMGEDDD